MKERTAEANGWAEPTLPVCPVIASSPQAGVAIPGWWGNNDNRCARNDYRKEGNDPKRQEAEAEGEKFVRLARSLVTRL
ncbi:MAG: hypothetical protein FJ012_10945 [Chloroflexi bacterium]|nr:hypothetical protein [Chloroflexota bacterium]